MNEARIDSSAMCAQKSKSDSMQLPIQIPTFEEIPIGQMVANAQDYKSYDRWIQNEKSAAVEK